VISIEAKNSGANTNCQQTKSDSGPSQSGRHSLLLSACVSPGLPDLPSRSRALTHHPAWGVKAFLWVSCFKPCLARRSSLDLKYPIRGGRLLTLQQSDRHVAYANPGGRFAVQRSMMCVAVNDEIGSVAINHFRQP
jgi:hypothetical protein